MASPPSEARDAAQARAARALLAVVSAVSLFLIVGLGLTIISGESFIEGDSMRGLLDHLVNGEGVSRGAVFLASAIAVTLLAPLTALMSVALFARHPSPRHILLAIGIVAVTALGVVLAFL